MRLLCTTSLDFTAKLWNVWSYARQTPEVALRKQAISATQSRLEGQISVVNTVIDDEERCKTAREVMLGEAGEKKKRNPERLVKCLSITGRRSRAVPRGSAAHVEARSPCLLLRLHERVRVRTKSAAAFAPVGHGRDRVHGLHVPHLVDAAGESPVSDQHAVRGHAPPAEQLQRAFLLLREPPLDPRHRGAHEGRRRSGLLARGHARALAFHQRGAGSYARLVTDATTFSQTPLACRREKADEDLQRIEEAYEKAVASQRSQQAATMAAGEAGKKEELPETKAAAEKPAVSFAERPETTKVTLEELRQLLAHGAILPSFIDTLLDQHKDIDRAQLRENMARHDVQPRQFLRLLLNSQFRPEDLLSAVAAKNRADLLFNLIRQGGNVNGYMRDVGYRPVDPQYAAKTAVVLNARDYHAFDASSSAPVSGAQRWVGTAEARDVASRGSRGLPDVITGGIGTSRECTPVPKDMILTILAGRPGILHGFSEVLIMEAEDADDWEYVEEEIPEYLRQGSHREGEVLHFIPSEHFKIAKGAPKRPCPELSPPPPVARLIRGGGRGEGNNRKQSFFATISPTKAICDYAAQPTHRFVPYCLFIFRPALQDIRAEREVKPVFLRKMIFGGEFQKFPNFGTPDIADTTVRNRGPRASISSFSLCFRVFFLF
ncbi:MAG: hypothetical protein BJ554DRAFT_1046 [Olpidium bornovanus]|uniref:Uncharacterized protein n=1 Tax=Olpidium bornovanus TaxID=278681 RepID=A0A8H7ZSN1_9FUNG|nr:MAG: hypothetical protein BJ554DRAFT_1046 [Olpidium bornovanus]